MLIFETTKKELAKASSKPLILILYQKSRPDTNLSGAVMLFIFDCVSDIFKCNFKHFVTLFIINLL